MKTFSRVLTLLVLLTAVCCSEPPSREYFVRSDGSGEYAFELEMTDSLSTYDISFYTKIDRNASSAAAGTAFPMNIVWRSPSGRFYTENVWYPSDSVQVRYRSAFLPSEQGTWGLEVNLPEEPGGMRGLGVVCSKRVQ